MDTKERILKFLLGRAISRQDYDEAKAGYEEALGNATDEQKLMATAYLQSVLNNQSANPKTNKHARHTGAEAYRIATTMLNGTFDEAAALTPLGTTSVRTRRQDYADAGNVAADFMRKNANQQTTTGGTGGGTAGTRYYFDPLKGLNRIGERAGSTTRGALVGGYAQQLLNNIRAAQALEGKSTIYGKVEGMYDDIAKLEGLLSGDLESDAAYNQLLDIAGKYEDGSTWANWFGSHLPGENKLEKAKKALTDEGYEFVDNFNFGDYANDFANYKVAKKGNEYYLINGDYSGVATNAGKVFMNTDWRDPSKEGHGYIIGNDGSFFIGDLNPHYTDSNSRYNAQLKQYVQDLANDTRATWKNYDRLTDLSNYDIIEDNSAALHGHSVADMSRYFDTDAPIVATIEGDDWNTARSRYGHTKLDDKRIKYYWKNGDENKSGTYQDLLNDLHINPNLSKADAGRGYTNWSSAGVSLAGLTPETEDFWTKDINRYNQFGNFFSNNWYWQTNKNLWTEDKIDADQDIQKNPDGTARFLVLLLATDDSQLTDEQRRIKNRWWTEHAMEAIYLISEQLRKNPDLFRGDHEKDYRRAWHAILKAYRNKLPSASSVQTDVTVEKEGGILKAAEGAYIDLQGNQYEGPEKVGGWASAVREKSNKIATEANTNTQRALENGRTKIQLKEIDRNAWTSSDTLRATALATDIAGLVAAIAGPETGGVGSAIAIGSGFASMAQDAVADFTDEKVSSGQAWKNVAINSGLAVGAFFGAKAPKMVKSAMKIVPKAMMALGAAGVVMDPEVQKTVDKIASGKSLNVNDWKNVSIILRTATGIATVGTMSYKGKKAGKNYEKALENKIKELKGTPSEVDPNVKYVLPEGSNEPIAINKEVFSEVNSKLKSGKEADVNEAIALLTKSVDEGGAGLTTELARSIRETVTGKKKGWDRLRFWKESPEEQRLREITPEEVGRIAAEDVLTEAKASVAEEIRSKAMTSHKSAFLNKLEGNKFIQKFNPTMNAALAGTKYKNIDALIAGEREKLPPIKPSQVVEATNPLSTEEYLNIRNEGAAEGAAAREAAARAEGLAAKEASLLRLQQQRENLSQTSTKLAEGEQAIRTASEAARSAKVDASAKIQEIDTKISDLKSDLAEWQLMSKEFATKSTATTKAGKSKASGIVRLLTAQKEKDVALAEIRQLQNSSSLAKAAVITGENGKLQLDKNARLSDATRKALDAKIKTYNAKLDTYNQLAKTKSGISAASKQISSAADAKNQEASIVKLIKELELARMQEEARIKKTDDDRTAAILAYRDLRSNLLKGKFGSSKKIAQRLNRLGDENNGLIAQRTQEVAAVRGRVKLAGSNRMNQVFASKGQNLGSTGRDVKVKTNGVDTTIAKGTGTVSYVTLRNTAAAKKAALYGRPNAKELSAADIKKIYPSNIRKNIRGAAYDPDANLLVIWKDGGKVNYQKLRK